MRKGIVLAGGSGTRLWPLTLATSKQLLPVGDKPMVYYPLSLLMLAGIQEIMIITTPEDASAFQRLLGDGSRFGISLHYRAQAKPNGIACALTIAAEWLAGSPSALVLGDNLLYGHGLTQRLAETNQRIGGATIFACAVDDPTQYGVVTLDARGQPIALVEKPLTPTSNLAVPGLYFYDESAPARASLLQPSTRGELEITDLNKSYLRDRLLNVEQLGRGTAWLDMGSSQSLLAASNFVAAIQDRQGLSIACLEEIALEQGWLSLDRLCALAALMGNSTYGKHLTKLIAHKEILQ